MSIRCMVPLAFLVIASSGAEASPVPRPRRLDANSVHILHQTRLDAFIAMFEARVRTKSDLDAVFLASLPVRDRREMRSELAKLGEIPKLSRRGDVMILNSGDVEFPVEFVDYQTNQFRIGGVPFTYDRSAAPGWQLRQFERAFAREVDRKHAAYGFSLIPRAHAGTIDAASEAMAKAMVQKAAKTGAGRAFMKRVAAYGSFTAVISAMATGGVSTFLCFVTNRGTGIDPELVWGTTCTAYNARNDKLKAADFKGQVGYTDELAKSLQLVRSGGKFDCTEFDPAKPDAPQLASGYIAEVDLLETGASTSKAPEAKNWKLFKGVIVKGVLKEADVFNADGKDERRLAHVTYNENPDNPLTVKLPQLDKAGTEQEPLDVPANYKRDSMLLENATKAQRMIFLAKTAQVWVKNCLTGQAEQKYLRVKGVSPLDTEASH